MALIELAGVRKVYRNGTVVVEALRGVDFAVEEGEYVALMGPSGSGKSTLMNILGCLDRPTAGVHRFEGREVHALDEDARARLRARRIGFVFQRFNLVPRATVWENVEMPLMYGDARNGRARVAWALERVGLRDRAQHLPAEISGGEAQRAAIARALVPDPALILADEPTGNLDSRTGAEILGLFDELHREGRTLVVVTHDAEVARRARRIVRLRDGRIEREEVVR